MNPLHLYNSDGRQIQEFIPLKEGEVGIYCCGPTVYNYAHIGNLRPYTHWDILRRTLQHFGYTVRHVMNITDVGHLSDDGDEGEDKMIAGARSQGMTVWEIARFYTEAFFSDIEKLNILTPTICCKATDHIDAMINLVKLLETRGYTYSSAGNIYFDSAQFPEYGRMALLERQNLQHGSRVEIDTNKKNPLDFVLWFTKGKFANQTMLWDSPWGRGYPGWHLECSAMSSQYLGERFDIHTGGIDHIPVHHSNEIAQSEAAFGHKWVNYWIHNEFLIIKSGKMAKSKGNFITLENLIDEGYQALDYRYFLLGGHYRSQLVFSSESLSSARSSRKALTGRVAALIKETMPCSPDLLGPAVLSRLQNFDAALGEDLNTPRALAELWNLLKDSKIPPAEKLTGVLNMDEVLGLNLHESGSESEEAAIDTELSQLLDERNKARSKKDWASADRIREELLAKGWKTVDSPEGSRLEKV